MIPYLSTWKINRKNIWDTLLGILDEGVSILFPVDSFKFQARAQPFTELEKTSGKLSIEKAHQDTH
jgi:hypothetical protein